MRGRPPKTGGSPSERLRHTEARRRYCERKFQGEYLDRLSAEDKWIISEVEGADEAEVKHSYIRPEKIHGALERRGFLMFQRNKADDWLEKQNIAVIRVNGISKVDKKEFEKALEKAFPSTMNRAGTEAISKEPPKLGRPRAIDWDGAHREMLRIAVTNGGLPQIQAELERKVGDWFELKGSRPAASKIREKVAQVYEEVRGGSKHR